MTVIGAIAQAGGIGTAESRQGLIGELLQAEERVRVLEVIRAALTLKRARLIAQTEEQENFAVPDLSSNGVDPARTAQILNGERRIFNSERESREQEIQLLQRQIPRLQSEILALKDQKALEEKQRSLNQELLADYEKLMKSGLARKPTYIEMKREEARIEGNVSRLQTEVLKAEIAVGEVQFKMGELRNNYRRRVITELQETDRSLLELSVTLPSAQRVRSTHTQQLTFLSTSQLQQPPIVVIRLKDDLSIRVEATLDTRLQPGDTIQVGSLYPASSEMMPTVGEAANAAPGTAF
jgi:polysaccharide export outer membrane protein